MSTTHELPQDVRDLIKAKLANIKKNRTQKNATLTDSATIMIDAALGYARRDIPVLPLWSVVDGRCCCGDAACVQNAGKHPDGDLVPHGVNDATTDEKRIRAWWTNKPDSNIGIRAGKIWFFDVDPKNRGGESFTKLVEEHGALPPTITVRTGGGGNHYWFMTNGVSISQRIGVLPGIDAISKGYVVAPPSLHKSGNRYEFAPGEHELAEAPGWLVELINGQPGEKKPPFDTASAFADAPKGKRYKTLLSLTGKLRNAAVPYEAAVITVLEASRKFNPVPEEKNVTKIVDSVYGIYPPGPEITIDPSWDAFDDDGVPHDQGHDAENVPKPFVIHWAREALEPQPAREWVIQDLIGPGDVAVTVGDAGSKKTWSHLDQCVCVAMSEEWLGRRTFKSTVLIVDEESGERRLKMRLGDCMRGHEAGADLPIRFTTLAGITLSCQDGANFLHSVIRETGARFVMMDALQDFALGMDENSGKEMAPVIHRLRKIAESCQCAIWLVHHLNKQGGYRGHSSIKGLVDLMLHCDSDTTSNLIQFTADKARDSLVTPFTAQTHFEIGRFWLSEAGAKRAVEILSRSERYVIGFLEKQPNQTATMTDIMGNADSCSPEAARRAVYKLAGNEKLVRVDAGGRGVLASYRLREVLL